MPERHEPARGPECCSLAQELSGRLLHLCSPFHLLCWKACFGDDPGIKSLCEASDSQKFMIVFPCTLLSLRETVHVLMLAGRDALGENKLMLKTLNLRCTANHRSSAFAVCSAGFIYHDEV